MASRKNKPDNKIINANKKLNKEINYLKNKLVRSDMLFELDRQRFSQGLEFLSGENKNKGETSLEFTYKQLFLKFIDVFVKNKDQKSELSNFIETSQETCVKQLTKFMVDWVTDVAQGLHKVRIRHSELKSAINIDPPINDVFRIENLVVEYTKFIHKNLVYPKEKDILVKICPKRNNDISINKEDLKTLKKQLKNEFFQTGLLISLVKLATYIMKGIYNPHALMTVEGTMEYKERTGSVQVYNKAKSISIIYNDKLSIWKAPIQETKKLHALMNPKKTKTD